MERIYCNRCGKELKIHNGIPHEDFIHICKAWGYFSKKDGMQQEFVICEDCAERMEQEFVIPSRLYDTTELL